VSSIFRRFSSSARLGDLLVQAGILTPNQLQEAVKNSRSKKLQIGQVLVMSGFMTPKDLQIVLEAQSMVRDKTIDVNLAIQCIKVARKIGATFSDVLEDYDAAAAQRARTGKLGELLTEAGLVDSDQLSATMERSINTGMPLGRMLVLNKIMSSELLQKALDIQVRLRDEIITREEAIAQLRTAAGLDGDAQGEAAPPPEKKKPVVRLGELLVMSGILTEADVMDALEWGLANQQPIGNVLVNQEMISKELLDAALFIQDAVREGKVNELQACECLSEVFSQGISPEEALDEVIPKLPKSVPEQVPITYQDLITLSRVVSEEDIEAAFDVQAQTAALIGKVLVLAGYMNVPTLQATLRCYQMIAKGYLSPEDAVATLDYCLHQNPDAPLSFEQALRDLKWNPDSGLQLRTERKPDKPTTSGTRFVGAGSKAAADAEPTSGDGEELAPAAEGGDTTSGDTTDEPEPPKSASKKAKTEAANADDEDSTEKSQSKSTEKASAKAEPADAKAESKKSGEQEEITGNGAKRKSAKEPVGEEESIESHSAGYNAGDETGPLTAISEFDSLTEPSKKAAEPEAAAVKTAPRKRNAFAEQLEGDEPEPGGNDTGHGANNNEKHDNAKSKSSLKEEPASKDRLEEDRGKEEPASKDSPEEKSTEETSAPEAKSTNNDTSTKKPGEEEDLDGGNLKSLLKGLISSPGGGSEGKAAAEPVGKKEADELKDITELSAEELLVQIMTTAHNPETAAKATKRGGRFSETILPEDAKARQLAKLVGKESSKELADKLAFDKGEDDPDNVGTAFARLAETYFDQGNYKEAQVIYERMLVHRLNDLGPDNPALVEDYNNLAMTLCVQGLFDKAEPFMKRAVHLYESLPPTDMAEYADYLHSLGTIQFKLSQFKESEETLLKVLNMRRELLPDDHEDIGRAMADYAKALKKLGKHDKAETIYKKARAILKKQP
jgi:hypothetical protein